MPGIHLQLLSLFSLILFKMLHHHIISCPFYTLQLHYSYSSSCITYKRQCIKWSCTTFSNNHLMGSALGVYCFMNRVLKIVFNSLRTSRVTGQRFVTCFEGIRNKNFAANIFSQINRLDPEIDRDNLHSKQKLQENNEFNATFTNCRVERQRRELEHATLGDVKFTGNWEANNASHCPRLSTHSSFPITGINSNSSEQCFRLGQSASAIVEGKE